MNKQVDVELQVAPKTCSTVAKNILTWFSPAGKQTQEHSHIFCGELEITHILRGMVRCERDSDDFFAPEQHFISQL